MTVSVFTWTRTPFKRRTTSDENSVHVRPSQLWTWLTQGKLRYPLGSGTLPLRPSLTDRVVVFTFIVDVVYTVVTDVIHSKNTSFFVVVVLFEQLFIIFGFSRILSSVFIRSSDQDITVERKTKDPRSFVVSQNYWSDVNFLLCQLLRYFFIVVEQISVRIMLRSNIFKFKRGQRRTDTQRYVCRHRREHTFSSRNGHIKIQKKICTCKPHIHIYICKDARTETHADINAFTHGYTQIASLYISCPWLFSLLLPVTTDMSRKCVFIFSVKFLCRSQFHGNQIKKQKSWVFASLMIKKKTGRMEKGHVSWHSNGMCFDVNSLSWHWPRSDVSLLCLLLIRLRHIHLQMIFVNQRKTALSWSVVSSRSSTMFFHYPQKREVIAFLTYYAWRQ